MAKENLRQYKNNLHIVKKALRLVNRYRNPNIAISKEDDEFLDKAFQIVDGEIENVITLLEVTE